MAARAIIPHQPPPTLSVTKRQRWRRGKGKTLRGRPKVRGRERSCLHMVLTVALLTAVDPYLEKKKSQTNRLRFYLVHMRDPVKIN